MGLLTKSSALPWLKTRQRPNPPLSRWPLMALLACLAWRQGRRDNEARSAAWVGSGAVPPKTDFEQAINRGSAPAQITRHLPQTSCVRPSARMRSTIWPADRVAP